MKRILHIVGLFVLLTQLNAHAEYIRRAYPGVRPSGMGGAFLAVADDANALWYNPAGLARIRGVHFNMIDVSTAVDSSDTLSRMGSAFAGNFNNLIRTDQELIRLQVRPTLTIPYFSLAVFDTFNGYFDLNAIKNFNILDPTTYTKKIDVFAFNDVGINTGFAIPMGEFGSIGASVRAFQRTAIDANLSAQDLLAAAAVTATSFSSAAYDALKKLQGGGLGLGLDLGAMAYIPLPKDYPRWTVAAVIEDAGMTSYRAFGGMQTLPGTKPTYHFGTALKYQTGRAGTVNLAFDYRNAFESLPMVKQVYLGAEYRGPKFGIRAGLHQGYPTAGLSIEFPPHTRLHLTTYASELGSGLWQSTQRWYMAQFIIGFNPL